MFLTQLSSGLLRRCSLLCRSRVNFCWCPVRARSVALLARLSAMKYTRFKWHTYSKLPPKVTEYGILVKELNSHFTWCRKSVILSPFQSETLAWKSLFSNDGQSTLLQSFVAFTLICVMHYAAFMKRYWYTKMISWSHFCTPSLHQCLPQCKSLTQWPN